MYILHCIILYNIRGVSLSMSTHAFMLECQIESPQAFVDQVTMLRPINWVLLIAAADASDATNCKVGFAYKGRGDPTSAELRQTDDKKIKVYKKIWLIMLI